MSATSPTPTIDADTGPAQGADFSGFGFDPRIATALAALGFDSPTPIQEQAMPPLLTGRDVIGRARTGSGKTAAFGLPLLQRVKGGGGAVKGLVLAPTRELALQVTEALRGFATKLPVRIATIYGGAAYGPQLSALRKGVSIVVGTPGRVIDHLDRGTLDISQLEMLVLDEADEMLRMGFFEEVERVFAATPPTRQVALFSATMPEPIRAVAQSRLNDPLEVKVEGRALSVDHIEQRYLVVPDRFKVQALARMLEAEPIEAALVFSRTRAGCAELADTLALKGLSVDALHGDLNQAARERVLMRFRAGGLRVVVATDVAARGIDVDRISHVVNLDLPNDAETYVHRIGRTGRAGRAGVAISFATPREVGKLRFWSRRLGVTLAEASVPSDAQIARVERARLVADLTRGIEAEGAPLADVLATLREGFEPEQIAAAALGLLARERGLSLDAELDEQPPRWAHAGRARNLKGEGHQERPERERRPRAHVDREEIDLFLPVGQRRGVRPADLVGALTNEAGLTGDLIGRITILEQKCFVRVEQEAGQALLASTSKIQLRGQPVPVSLARPRAAPGGAPGRRTKGGPRRAAPFKRGPRR